MIESKHTPGPWEWAADRFRGGYSGLIGPDGAEVLFPNHANDGDEGAAWFEDFPTAADARLIAAAPDLLAACEAVLDSIEKADLRGTILWINPPHQRLAVHESASERLQAAIAKAKGN